jgi:hypothetical protein
MDWKERPAKQKARDWLLSQLDLKRVDTYLGLPAGEAIFERLLVKEHPVSSMELFERDLDVAEYLRESIFAYNLRGTTLPEWKHARSVIVNETDVDVWLGLAREFAPSFPSYDLAWLDYCGPITSTRLENLQNLAEAMPDDGVLAVTFMACREGAEVFGEMVEADSSVAIIRKNRRSDAETPEKHLKRIRIVTNALLEKTFPLRIKVLPYQDGAPMLLFVIKKSDSKRGIVSLARRTSVEVLPSLKD